MWSNHVSHERCCCVSARVCIFIALLTCFFWLFLCCCFVVFGRVLDYRIIFFYHSSLEGWWWALSISIVYKRFFLQIVRIIAILMWLWFVARQPNSSMLLSITSAIP